MSNRIEDATAAVIVAARKVLRGCSCEYDHRCGNCQNIVNLHEALRKLDETTAATTEDQSASTL